MTYPALWPTLIWSVIFIQSKSVSNKASWLNFIVVTVGPIQPDNVCFFFFLSTFVAHFYLECRLQVTMDMGYWTMICKFSMVIHAVRVRADTSLTDFKWLCWWWVGGTLPFEPTSEGMLKITHSTLQPTVLLYIRSMAKLNHPWYRKTYCLNIIIWCYITTMGLKRKY